MTVRCQNPRCGVPLLAGAARCLVCRTAVAPAPLPAIGPGVRTVGGRASRARRAPASPLLHVSGSVLSDPLRQAVPPSGAAAVLRLLAGVVLVLALLPLLISTLLPLLLVPIVLALCLGPRMMGIFGLMNLIPRPGRAGPRGSGSEQLRFRMTVAAARTVEVLVRGGRTHVELGDEVEVLGLMVRGRLHAVRVRNLQTGVSDLSDGVAGLAIVAAVILLLVLLALGAN